MIILYYNIFDTSRLQIVDHLKTKTEGDIGTSESSIVCILLTTDWNHCNKGDGELF